MVDDDIKDLLWGERHRGWRQGCWALSPAGEQISFTDRSPSFRLFFYPSWRSSVPSLRRSNPVRCNWLTHFVQAAIVIVKCPSWTSSPFRIRVASLIVNGDTVVSDIDPIFWSVPETSQVNEIMTGTR